MVVVSNDFIMHNRVTSIFLGWVGCKSCEYSLEKCWFNVTAVGNRAELEVNLCN